MRRFSVALDIPKQYLKSALEHGVTLGDMGRAVTIAAVLNQDMEAVNYFTGMMNSVAASAPYFITLDLVEPKYRGYVYQFDYQRLIEAGVCAEYELSSIINQIVPRRTNL